jgi:hypothetical protein
MGDSSELAAEPVQGRPDHRSVGLLQAAAVIAAITGAVGSVGLMFWVGHRNPSRVLLALFLIWDVSPFVALLVAEMVSKRWPETTRVTLHVVTLIIALSSLALYGDVVWRPRPQPAFLFLVVPFASWLLMAVVVPMAALISGRTSRPSAGA